MFICIQLDWLCIVSGYPEYIKRDDKNRMHNPDGYAIEWKDWYGQYYIHWVWFTPEEWDKYRKATALDIITRPNQDQKRAMMMVYGNDKLITELWAKVVNKMKDGMWYDMTLYCIEDKSQEGEDRYMVFYEAIDPSKDEKIVLRVPPEFRNRTAQEAKYWTFPQLWEEYEKTGKIDFIKET